MAAGDLSSTADQDLEIRTAQSDGGDKWYIINLELPSTVDVQVVFDNGYQSRYSNALPRIREELLALQEKYFNEFGIDINCFSPTLYTSYADQCSTSYSTPCSHASNGACNNSIVYQSGLSSLQPYHHKNTYNILYRVPLPDITQNLKIFYMGHDNCRIDGMEHITNPSNGMAYSTAGLAMIMNFSTKAQEIKTLVHEFGHLYGAIDHYGYSGAVSTNDMNSGLDVKIYSEDCIYGENKDDVNICNSLMICDGCRITITENKYKYGID